MIDRVAVPPTTARTAPVVPTSTPEPLQATPLIEEAAAPAGLTAPSPPQRAEAAPEDVAARQREAEMKAGLTKSGGAVAPVPSPPVGPTWKFSATVSSGTVPQQPTREDLSNEVEWKQLLNFSFGSEALTQATSRVQQAPGIVPESFVQQLHALGQGSELEKGKAVSIVSGIERGIDEQLKNLVGPAQAVAKNKQELAILESEFGAFGTPEERVEAHKDYAHRTGQTALVEKLDASVEVVLGDSLGSLERIRKSDTSGRFTAQLDRAERKVLESLPILVQTPAGQQALDQALESKSGPLYAALHRAGHSPDDAYAEGVTKVLLDQHRQATFEALDPDSSNSNRPPFGGAAFDALTNKYLDTNLFTKERAEQLGEFAKNAKVEFRAAELGQLDTYAASPKLAAEKQLTAVTRAGARYLAFTEFVDDTGKVVPKLFAATSLFRGALSLFNLRSSPTGQGQTDPSDIQFTRDVLASFQAGAEIFGGGGALDKARLGKALNEGAAKLPGYLGSGIPDGGPLPGGKAFPKVPGLLAASVGALDIFLAGQSYLRGEDQTAAALRAVGGGGNILLGVAPLLGSAALSATGVGTLLVVGSALGQEIYKQTKFRNSREESNNTEAYLNIIFQGASPEQIDKLKNTSENREFSGLALQSAASQLGLTPAEFKKTLLGLEPGLLGEVVESAHFIQRSPEGVLIERNSSLDPLSGKILRDVTGRGSYQILEPGPDGVLPFTGAPLTHSGPVPKRSLGGGFDDVQGGRALEAWEESGVQAGGFVVAPVSLRGYALYLHSLDPETFPLPRGAA